MDNFHNEMLDSIKNSKKVLEETYLFLPVEPEKNIVEFENKFNVRIPEDYRFFLLNVANGIVNKNEWGFNFINKIDFIDFFYKDNEYNPSIPFELPNKVVFSSSSEYKEASPYKKVYPYEITFDEDYEILEKGFSNGQIDLVGYGCGTNAFLIVNGNEYGNVWINDLSSNNEVYPDYDFKRNKPRFSFTDWLLERINRHLTIYNQNIEWENRVKAEEKIKQDKIDQQNKELEINRIDQIKRNKLAEQNKEIEREKLMILKSKKPRRDLLTIIIDKLFN